MKLQTEQDHLVMKKIPMNRTTQVIINKIQIDQ